MGQRGLGEEKIRQIVDLRRQGRGVQEIADEAGVHRSTVTKYLKLYGTRPEDSEEQMELDAEVGELVNNAEVDGTVFMITEHQPASVEELIERSGLDMKRWVVTHYKTGEWNSFYRNKERTGHTIVPMFKAQASFKRIMDDDLEQAILTFVQEHVTPIKAPKRVLKKTNQESDFMTVWGLWDAHVGMYAWGDEVRESFDINIARNRVLNSIDDMANELEQYSHEKIVMPMGNDFMHFDNVRMTTTNSDHFLDYDGRYAKVFKVALECLVYQVQRALDLTDQVDVLWIPGNHDYTSSFCLVAAVQQRFLHDSRVSVDLGANPRKYRRHGGTLLGFDHGQKCNPMQLARIMAEEQIGQWSSSTYREIQIGHRHQRWLKEFPGVIPTNGVTIRLNPALCNVDFWHHEQGLIGEPVKSVEAYRYDRTGYRGSHLVWARDEDCMRPMVD